MQDQVNKIIRPRDIESVSVTDVFEDYRTNKLVEKLCKEVLIMSENEKNRHRYGEVAIAFNLKTGKKVTLVGAMHHIELNESINPNARYFNQIIQEGSDDSVIIVHNHPNDLRFSFQDMRLFYENTSILSIVAVGNTKGIYFIIDENDDKYCRKRLQIDTIKRRSNLIKKKYTRNQIEDELNEYINRLLDDTDRLRTDFGFRFVHLSRKVVE